MKKSAADAPSPELQEPQETQAPEAAPQPERVDAPRVNARGDRRGLAGRGQAGANATGSGPLFELRLKLGISQEEMGRRLGCSLVTVSRCETAGIIPSQGKHQKAFFALQQRHHAEGGS